MPLEIPECQLKHFFLIRIILLDFLRGQGFHTGTSSSSTPVVKSLTVGSVTPSLLPYLVALEGIQSTP